MSILNASDARARLYTLIDEANDTHEPIVISGKRHNAVLVGEDDWRSIQETLYLDSILGMKESILAGMDEAIDSCTESIDW